MWGGRSRTSVRMICRVRRYSGISDTVTYLCLLTGEHSLFFLGIETSPFNNQLERDVSFAVDT
jgi:hypothetical protein